MCLEGFPRPQGSQVRVSKDQTRGSNGGPLQPLGPEAQIHFARNAWKALESIWILPTATKRMVSIHDLYEAMGLAATHLSASSCPPFDFPKASFAGLHQRRGAWPKHPSGKA